MSKTSADRLRAYLEEGHKSTKAEIAEYLDVSERQVQRRIQELRKAGVTIALEQRGRKDVYFIPEQYRSLNVDLKVHAVELTQFQLVALAVAARASEAVLDSTPLLPHLEKANQAILEVLTRDTEEKGTLNLREEAGRWYFPDAPRVPLRSEALDVLLHGMRETITVEILYYSASGREQRWRRVDPVTFVYREGSWFLCAWCHTRREYRTFSLADVHEARLYIASKKKARSRKNKSTEDDVIESTPWLVFDHDPFDVEEFFRDTFHAVGGDPVEVRLHVAGPQARSFVRKHHHPTQQIEKHEDGSITVSMECAGLDEVRSFILGWGAGVRVLDPPELREQLRAVTLEVAAMYA